MGTTFQFGARSERYFIGVDPDLVAVARRALQLSAIDFAVIAGVRTLEEQKYIYASGRSRPGPILTKTMHSRHLIGKRGVGEAIDLVPVNPATNRVDFKYLDGFREIGRAMLAAAAELKFPLRWGWDWDNDGHLQEAGETDGPHFERIEGK